MPKVKRRIERMQPFLQPQHVFTSPGMSVLEGQAA